MWTLYTFIEKIVSCKIMWSASHAEGPQFEPGQCQFILNTGYITVCKKSLEAPGIDPGTSRMLSERSTI